MKNSQSRNRTGRKPALSSIGLAVVATLITGGAHAADTSYDFDGAANAYGHQTQNLPLSNSAPVGASILGDRKSTRLNSSHS